MQEGDGVGIVVAIEVEHRHRVDRGAGREHDLQRLVRRVGGVVAMGDQAVAGGLALLHDGARGDGIGRGERPSRRARRQALEALLSGRSRRDHLPEATPAVPIRHSSDAPARRVRAAMAPALKLHVLPPSHPCMTAEAALRLKGLEFEKVTLTPGPHNEEMERVYGAGRTTVPGLLVDDEPVHGSVAILERLEQLAPDPPLYPERDRRPRARGRALGRRRAAGPRPPAAVGRAALPPRGDGHVRRRRAARPGRHRLRDEVRARRRGSTTGSARSAWPRTSPGCRRRSTTSTRSPPTASSAATRPTAADLQIGATLRVLLCVGDVRPLIEGRAAERIARRWFPDYDGDVPAGAFPRGWVPA